MSMQRMGGMFPKGGMSMQQMGSVSHISDMSMQPAGDLSLLHGPGMQPRSDVSHFSGMDNGECGSRPQLRPSRSLVWWMARQMVAVRWLLALPASECELLE